MTAVSSMSAAREDYLEAILRCDAHGGARVGALAQALGLHKSTVSATLKALAARGLVRHSPYGTVRLTPAGRLIARRVDSRHARLAGFFGDVLLLDDKAACADACRAEHVLSAAALERLTRLAELLCGNPARKRAWRGRFRLAGKRSGRRGPRGARGGA